MRYRFLLLFTLLFTSFSGQAQYRHLLQKSYAERYVALDTTFYGPALKQDSVTFFQELKKLAKTAEKARDEQLVLETHLLKGQYYMFGKQTNHRAFEKYMLGLLETADQKQIPHLQIRIRQKLGYYYFAVKHKYGQAFTHYLNSYQLMKDLSVNELPNKQEMVGDIGAAYYQFGDNANARKFLTEAWTIAPSYKKRLPINLTNTLGLIYREEKKYDSAEFYLWKCYRMAEKLKDSTWMGIAAGNIGIGYFHQKKYDEAVPLLEMDARESIKANEFDNASTSLLILTRIWLEKNDLPKAENLVAQVKSMLPETSDLYKHLKELYPVQARIYALKGDYAKAYRYTDSAHFVKDSLFTRRNSSLVLAAERKIEIEKHKAEMERLEAQEKLQTTLRNSLIGGIFLLIIIALLVINRQRMVHRQKQEKLEKEKHSIESELEIASRQLSNFTDHIREKNKLIEQFTAEIKKHQDQFGETEHLASKEARDKLLQATILTDDQWEEFRSLFDKVHAGYLHRLREKLPILSPADTRYIVLSKLNLTPKEMASMLGVRPDAIRLYRHRLRKKLNIEDDKLLEDVVKNI